MLNFLLTVNGRTQKEADEFKKKILRYLLLSWTLTMTDVSELMYDLFYDKRIIYKGLATDEEMKRINRFG